MAGEIIARTVEQVPPHQFKTSPQRIVLPDAPAPTSIILENMYYPTVESIVKIVKSMMKS